MNNDFNNGQPNDPQPPKDFGRSEEARQAFDNGQTSWSNPGTPYSNVPPTPNDPSANSAQTLGIIGLIVSLVCCRIAGIVLGILAINKAKSSRMRFGYELPEARTGRICGILAIIFAAVALVCIVIYIIIYISLFGFVFGSLYDELSATIATLAH